jgi:beta-phosphoglucomutase family hydrolase
MKNNLAVLFDMDGVIVDNYSYHRRAWSLFCGRYDLDFDRAFRSSVFGGTNRDHLETFFGRALSGDEVTRYESEKESLYRELYRPHIRPLPGLIRFLDELKEAIVPMALATSSPPVNVGFVLEKTGAAGYFHHVIDSSGVTRGKPDPEIYLKAADALGMDPGRCVVFEDSRNGIRAAQRAGTKVVAVATTHTADELPAVDLVIKDFKYIKLDDLQILF